MARRKSKRCASAKWPRCAHHARALWRRQPHPEGAAASVNTLTTAISALGYRFSNALLRLHFAILIVRRRRLVVVGRACARGSGMKR
jgi:hypothetical protein